MIHAGTVITAPPSAPTLETIPDFATRNAQSGGYPSTAAQLRHIHRNRRALGIEAAFVRIGARWLVNRERFYQLLEASGA